MLRFQNLALGGRVLGLISMSAVAGSITFAAAVLSYQRLGYPALQFSKTTARELIRDGAPMLAIALAVAVQPYIDANLLFKLVPTEVLGWYGAAWAVAGTLVAPATILGATMYPRLSKVAVDRSEFSRTLRMGLRALLFVAMLSAAGTYLFGTVVIGLIYSERQFGPAADILRAFTPALLLIYIDMILGYAILAVGKAGQLAKAKVVAVVVTTGVELMLIPYFQTRFSNGGMGVVLAMACGEVVMVAAAVLLLRDVIERAMFLDFLRALVSGFATVLLIRSFPPISPFIGIPLCVASFAAFSWAVGLVRPADLDALLPGIRRSRKSSI
jgi:O-antigen/teichoic acid export membrane protein